MTSISPPAERNARRRGFTVVELAMVMAVFTVIGYALVEAVNMGNDSSRQVIGKASTNADLRRSASSLTDELVMAEASGIEVVELKDGNHQLNFMEPISVGAVHDWGVDDPMLGTNAGWNLRYTVETVVQNGAVERRLLRQVVDDGGQVRGSRVVAEGLRSGQAGDPGFSCILAGDVWIVTIRTEQDAWYDGGKEMSFHVRVRN